MWYLSYSVLVFYVVPILQTFFLFEIKATNFHRCNDTPEEEALENDTRERERISLPEKNGHVIHTYFCTTIFVYFMLLQHKDYGSTPGSLYKLLRRFDMQNTLAVHQKVVVLHVCTSNSIFRPEFSGIEVVIIVAILT